MSSRSMLLWHGGDTIPHRSSLPQVSHRLIKPSVAHDCSQREFNASSTYLHVWASALHQIDLRVFTSYLNARQRSVPVHQATFIQHQSSAAPPHQPGACRKVRPESGVTKGPATTAVTVQNRTQNRISSPAAATLSEKNWRFLIMTDQLCRILLDIEGGQAQKPQNPLYRRNRT